MPVFCLMRNSETDKIQAMHEIWDEMAKDNGFDGVFLMTGRKPFFNYSVTDAQFTYQPGFSGWNKRESIDARLQKYFSIAPKRDGNVKYLYDYEKVWNKIIIDAKKNAKNNFYFGGFVGFDDTPRRGSDARMFKDCSPEKFEKFFREFYRINCDNNKELLFLTAWNEWGEGAYLEPDEENGYAYLEALKRAIDSVDVEKN